MNAADATNCVRLCYLQHGGLNISDRYRPDRRHALVARDTGFASAHADDQATAALTIGDVLCGMIGRPTLFTSMSKVGKREVVDRAPVSVAKSAAMRYAVSLVWSGALHLLAAAFGHLRLQRRPLLPALSRRSGPIPGRRPRNQSSLVQHVQYTKCEYSNAQVSALLRCEPVTVWGNQWITLILDK